MDDKRGVYHCHVHDLHHIIWWDDTRRDWRSMSSGTTTIHPCGEPSVWRDLFGNIGPNYSSLPMSVCGGCDGPKWRSDDYLCGVCRGS